MNARFGQNIKSIFGKICESLGPLQQQAPHTRREDGSEFIEALVWGEMSGVGRVVWRGHRCAPRLEDDARNDLPLWGPVGCLADEVGVGGTAPWPVI
jgi:hypothetical protein